MKKFGFISIFITGILVMSCSSTSSTIATFNPGLPEEEQCKLFFGAATTEIISFNGTIVNWNEYSPNTTLVLAIEYNVIIPSGRNVIIASYRGSDATILNFRIEYNFEAGKQYTLGKRLNSKELYIFEKSF